MIIAINTLFYLAIEMLYYFVLKLFITARQAGSEKNGISVYWVSGFIKIHVTNIRMSRSYIKNSTALKIA